MLCDSVDSRLTLRILPAHGGDPTPMIRVYPGTEEGNPTALTPPSRLSGAKAAVHPLAAGVCILLARTDIVAREGFGAGVR